MASRDNPLGSATELRRPEMDGGTTFDRIRRIRPGMPVLLSSGYAINGQAHEILRRG
jgi:hypothetical protein